MYRVVDNYTDIARNYDKIIKLYTYVWSIFGFRYQQWRQRAIDALELKNGDVVVDLGCGTGLNFPYLHKKIGPSGKIIGVDINPSMLEVAKTRAKKNGWQNVSLILDDLMYYESPGNADAIISTYTLSLIGSSDKVIQKAERNLRAGSKILILDFKHEKLSQLAKIILPVWLCCVKDYPKESYFFGKEGPWDSIKKYFQMYTMEEWYGGLVYLAIGRKTVLKYSLPRLTTAFPNL